MQLLFGNNMIEPWAYICSKGFFAGLIFGGAYFRTGLLSDGILRFKMGLAYSEGLLSEGYLRLRFGRLILGSASFFGGGGGRIIGEI